MIPAKERYRSLEVNPRNFGRTLAPPRRTAICRSTLTMPETVLHMPEIDVSRDFLSALAHSYDERVLLSTRQFLLVDRIGNSVLID